MLQKKYPSDCNILMYCILILLITMCSVMAGGCSKGNESSRPLIRIAVNPWTGSALDAHIAKIILEEKMGCPVSLIEVDGKAQWASLAEGTLDVSLEVWPSGRGEQVKKYIDEQKLVENIGILGVVGKVSWYVPTYVVDEHPELATWEGFKDHNLTNLFITPRSNGKGQFLAGDPSWVQYDRDIIRNLELNLQVVQAGSENAVLDEVEKAYSRKQPILFYFWTPHAIHAKYRLTEVKLPKYSDACYEKADQGGINCDYSPEVLFKVAWPGLKKKSPAAYQFLKNFIYTTEDQIMMLDMVDLEKKSVETVAREWIKKNEEKWRTWLPIQ